MSAKTADQAFKGARHHLLGRSKRFPAAPSTTLVTQELFVPFFISGHGFTPALWIQNVRIDTAITVTPVIRFQHEGELALSPVNIPAHATTVLDINAELAALHRAQPDIGTIVIRYEFPSAGAISAFVRNSNEPEGLFVNSHSRERSQFMGTVLDAVLWSPTRHATGFVAIVNTSSEPRRVTTTFVSNRGSKTLSEFTMNPHQFSVVSIDEILGKSVESGGGVRVAADGKPGDVIEEGAVMDRNAAYARRLQFTDAAAHHDNTFHTDFFYIGRQPASYGFPSVAFHSVAVVRNLESSPVRVTPVLSFVHEGTAQNVTLPDMSVGGLQTAVLDFNEAQDKGMIPQEFHAGSLELRPSAGHSQLLAELFSHDENGGYEIGPSLVQHPGRGNSSVWKIDGVFQTVISIHNFADVADTATLTFYKGAGSGFVKSIDIPAGGTIRLNVRDLQQEPPDVEGNSFDGTTGVVSGHGAHGSKSKLLIDRLIYSPNQSDYVGFPASPCFDTLDAFIDLAELSNSGGNEFNSLYTETWSDGSVSQVAVAPASISNSALATSSGTIVTFSTSVPADAIQTVEVDYFEEEIDSFCNVIVLEFALFIEFELASTKSQTNFSDPRTNTKLGADGSVECIVQDYCNARTSPPACSVSFVLQEPTVLFGSATCSQFYITTWFAERFTGDTSWNCFPLLPGQNSAGTTDPTLGECTK